MIFKIELDTLIKWKILCNKSFKSYFIESRTVKFVFFRFFYDFFINFTSSLFNAPWAPGSKCIFFTFRSCRPLDGRKTPCRPLGGRQSPIFENFPIRHIFLKFCFFLNIKMKKTPERERARSCAGSRPAAVGSPRLWWSSAPWPDWNPACITSGRPLARRRSRGCCRPGQGQPTPC